MKKLFFVLSFACLHAHAFCAQEALPAKPVITPEGIESDARYKVGRAETETNILFSVSLKREFCLNIIASIEKATGIKRVQSRKTLFSRNEWRDTWTFYDEYPEETYNALQALYEKQQRDAGRQEQEENKEEERS
jgi:hypothetical protein